MSPPPTTAISRSLKKNPSQVAQADTPRPRSRVSLSSPSHSADAPVATIDGLGAVLGAARPDPERALGEVDPVDVDVDDARAEALGLGAHRGHQLGPLDAVRKARVVLDVAGQHQLAARRRAGEDDRLEVGARRVDRGGQAGRPGADDHDLGVDAALAAGDGGWTAGVVTGSLAAGASSIAIENPPNGLGVSVMANLTPSSLIPLGGIDQHAVPERDIA